LAQNAFRVILKLTPTRLFSLVAKSSLKSSYRKWKISNYVFKLPYGEEIYRPNQGADKVRQKFTSYERDIETDLDFAQARFYNSKLGRFNTVDPLMASADIINPQTFNRYAYVGNNPVNITDPTGEIWGVSGNAVQWFKDKEAMVAAGFTAYNSLIGYVQGVGNVALNPNAGTYSPITNDIQALRNLAALGATAAQLAASAGVLGVSLAAAGVIIGAGGVVYLYTQYPAAAGRLKQAGCPAYIECLSVDDSRLMEGRYEMTNAGENSSGSSASEGGGSSSAGNANPDPNDNKPKADTRPANERISGSLKKSKSYASELGHLNEAELTKISKQKGAEAQKAKKMLKLIKEGDRLREKGNKK
jgi:RHS repeat-associated protein